MTNRRPIAMLPTHSSVFLDLVRSLAALLVLFEHWRNLFFVDYLSLPTPRMLLAPVYIICSAGHQAVVIFFILSGYLISTSIFKMLAQGVWSWRQYLLRRLVRLWVVLLPGLLLCFLWDEIGLRLRIAPRLYSGASGNHMIANVAATHTISIFGANLFFLQDILAPTFGSDGALWSLANEFWYYIIFPLALFVVLPTTPLTKRLGYLCALGLVSWFVGPNILASFPLWLIGTGLALVRYVRLSSVARPLAAALYLPLFFGLGRSKHITGLTSDYVLGIATFFLFWIFLSARQTFRSSSIVTLGRQAAQFSYTLYIVHTPFLVLLAAFITRDVRWLPSLEHWTIAISALMAAVAYAYAIAYLTEFQTDTFRVWIEARLPALADANRYQRETSVVEGD